MSEIILALAIGFMAQMVDGALGMAFGVISASSLLSLGFTPASASACVHLAKTITTLFSGLSHLKLQNVEKEVVKKLLIPGALAGIVGVFVCVLAPLNFVKPFVSIYLLAVGCSILLKFFKVNIVTITSKNIPFLGAAAGFLDSIGGGGWGPIITSTLIAGGHNPRFAIGSVNLAEFFITLTQTITFISLLGLIHLPTAFGLMIGGAIAAPLAAVVCKKAPIKLLMLLVGFGIIVLSAKNLFML